MINILLLIIFKFQDLLQLNQQLEVVWEAWTLEWAELHLQLEGFNLLISKWGNRIIKWGPWAAKWVEAWVEVWTQWVEWIKWEEDRWVVWTKWVEEWAEDKWAKWAVTWANNHHSVILKLIKTHLVASNLQHPNNQHSVDSNPLPHNNNNNLVVSNLLHHNSKTSNSVDSNPQLLLNLQVETRYSTV